MHDGMPYGRNQGQGQGHSREVDRQSPTGLIFLHIIGWRLSVSINDMLCYMLCYVICMTCLDGNSLLVW